jgi:hypothetical protein
MLELWNCFSSVMMPATRMAPSIGSFLSLQGVGSAAASGSASAEGVGCRVTDRQTRHSSCLSKENFGICGKRWTREGEKQRVTARASKRVGGATQHIATATARAPEIL